MLLRLNKYLKELRRDAHRFERIGINNEANSSFWARQQRRIICLLPALLLFWFLKKGFSSEFLGYASTALAMLVGLLISSIIFILDKYQPLTKENPNSKEKLWDTQAYNYTKQFACITGYSIVLAIFVLVLLSFSALFKEFFAIDIFLYQPNLKAIDRQSIYNFIIVVLIVIQRLSILYALASITYNILYVISSMIQYMIVKIERK